MFSSWSSHSPDFNAIDNLWRTMETKIRQRSPENLAELKEMCIDEWAIISPQVCESLILSYESRLPAVIINKGFTTKY